MVGNLTIWEQKLKQDLQVVARPDRQKAGTLLVAVPGRAEWDCFLEAVRDGWDDWRDKLSRYPNCLLVLYGGLAFYEYEDNTFWQQFAEAVGSQPLTPQQQAEINPVFAETSRALNLKVIAHDYVSSAIHHIGVPLSLWDGFVDACEWALAQSGWETLPEVEWGEAAARIAGSRARLAKFLRDDREIAAEMMWEMIEARCKLADDPSLKLSDLPQFRLLRREHFEDVPQTIEFLFPQHDEKHRLDLPERARLAWDDERCGINLYLPAVKSEEHPATWRVGEQTQCALTGPDVWRIDSAAFAPEIALDFESGDQRRPQRLRGAWPWALFDLESEMPVNPERQQLPLRPYALIAPERLDAVKREGFDEEDYPINEAIELRDGTTCYVTRLYPTARRAALTIAHGARTTRIMFRAGARLEARIYPGEGTHAASFDRFEDSLKVEYLKVERLPLPCVVVPVGYFNDPATILRDKFQVAIDEEPDAGTWEKRREDDTFEYYFWRWCDPARAAGLVGRRTISVKAPELGFSFSRRIEMKESKSGMDECWACLPGACLPWFLLAQSAEGMKWSDLMLARAAVTPEMRFSHALMRRAERCGLLRQRGQRWEIAESRAVIETTLEGELALRFCGDPSLMWRMFRRLRDLNSDLQLPLIEVVVDERRQLPYLMTRWRHDERGGIERFLKNIKTHNVKLVADLWD